MRATVLEPLETATKEAGPGRWLALPRYRALLAVGASFAASRLLLIVITAAVAIVRHRAPIELWNQWDSKWYIGIATHGYHWSIHGKPALAFFPLYPLLLHIGLVLGIPAVAAGIALSNVCLILALLYLYRLADLEWGESIAGRSVWLLALFPTSFFTFAPYTESLFLLCAIACFYHARRQQALVAGAWMAAAIMTRSTGIILLPAVVVLLDKDRLRRLALAIAPSIMAIAGYAAYLHARHFGVADVLSVQRAWHRGLTYPWTGFLASLHWLVNHGPSNTAWAAENILTLTVAALFLLVTALAWGRLSPAARVYCAGFWALALLWPQWLDGYYAPFSSIDRFVLALFPLAIWFASRTTYKSLVRILAAFGVLMGASTVVYLAGGWVG